MGKKSHRFALRLGDKHPVEWITMDGRQGSEFLDVPKFNWEPTEALLNPLHEIIGNRQLAQHPFDLNLPRGRFADVNHVDILKCKKRVPYGTRFRH